MPAQVTEFTVQLDRALPGSIPAKLVRAIRQAIDDGVLRPGDRLPPTRELATRLEVSRGSVVSAYDQLVAEGYFTAGHGRGTRVNPNLAQLHGGAATHFGRAEPARPRKVVELKNARATTKLQATAGAKTSLQPNATGNVTGDASSAASITLDPLSDLTRRPAWRAAWRKAATSERLDHSFAAEGDPILLEEIAEHLRTMRGTLRSADDLLVTAGAREGLGLILTALGTTHGRELTVGVEESGLASLREVAQRHGVHTVGLPVDSDGLVTSALPRGVLDAVIVTPTHQYPRGAALPLGRRVELLEWANANGVIVIEDDFDTELRYVSAPLPTLAALDNPVQGVVITLGSYSATLSPGLAAGFLVVPKNIRRVLLAVREDLGCPVSPILQLALAELLASGELRRHVARVRKRARRSE